MTEIRAALMVALSLSIGWGVRGNFGHEYGAMLPGVLAAIAAVLTIGRPEWLPRIGYVAFFGGLGWAFGGSISYMQVIAYTHSGHLPSQVYGFAGLWLIGFLWAAMGGLATAWSVEASPRRLESLFRPLVWVFGGWIVLHVVLRWVAAWEAGQIDDRTWQRQASVLYWLDTDWAEAAAAGLSLIAFEAWDQRRRRRPAMLLWAAGGAAAGWLVQAAATATGLADRLLVWPLVQYQADPALVARLAAEEGVPIGRIQADLLTNWPNVFHIFPQHVGWILGLAMGLTAYACRRGRFRSGSGLLLSMVGGWFVGFLLLPVFLGFGGAGLRMTPPRGDNWAGIVGVVGATILWLAHHGYRRVVVAGVLCGALGGAAFAVATCLKLVLVAPGNPRLVTDPAVVAAWQFWQQANWHSVLEQVYGFLNGLALFTAIAWLARGPSRFAASVRREGSSWTLPFAIAFVLFGIVYLNMSKNVPVWVAAGAVPRSMRLPGVAGLELSAAAWFNVAFALLAAAGTARLFDRRTRPLAWLPASWAGRGQLLFLAFLWIVIVMNFERALVRFDESRLVTEGAVLVNAVIVSWMVSGWRRPAGGPALATARAMPPPVPWSRLAGLAAALLVGCATVLPFVVRSVYGDRYAGHAGEQRRFGPDALWKTTPIFKSKRHS